MSGRNGKSLAIAISSCDFPHKFPAANLVSSNGNSGNLALAMLLETSFPLTSAQWLGCGSTVVRMWLGYGSDVAQIWLGCGSECGSDVARTWHVFSDVAEKVWHKLRERGC